ncbi:hypothetical protein BDN72DRAFT_844854 [Pluteus cervinus]|uniref:Uncharacterized protein n=1 Tax=Pluteus cervinus TaxID=181527 RepID=A0ACD3AJG0_9AGAR|nr:hypothetical protein BDN72DRAFT_844854 [Pluteus cervinus]
MVQISPNDTGSESSPQRIQSLPTELIEEILIHTWDAEIADCLRAPFGTLLKSNWVTLRLSHVCWRWRTIALRLSNLWSTIIVQVPHGDTVDLVKFYLQNSAQQKLDLHLSTCCPSTVSKVRADNQTDYVIEVIKLWLDKKVYPRWRSINLNTFNTGICRELEALGLPDPEMLPDLETAWLHLGFPGREEQGPWLRALMRCSSKMRDMAMYNPVPISTCRRLKALRLGMGIDIQVLRKILQICGELVTLTVTTILPGSVKRFPASTLGRIAAPSSLENLTFKGLSMDVGAILDYFTASHLQALSITQWDPLFTNATSRSLCRFFEQSKCAITTFHISDQNLRPSTVEPTSALLFSALPYLEHVRDCTLRFNITNEQATRLLRPEVDVDAPEILRVPFPSLLSLKLQRSQPGPKLRDVFTERQNVHLVEENVRQGHFDYWTP